MATYKIGDILVFKGRKAAEVPIRKELSATLIDSFGNGPYDELQIRAVLCHSFDFFTSKFQDVCHRENSYTFYKVVFWFHEQITSLTLAQAVPDDLPAPIAGTYIAEYRRILKMILETAIDVAMCTGEKMNEEAKDRAELILDDLMYLGHMILACADMIAETQLIEDSIECVFNAEELFEFRRKHHYEQLFGHLEQLSTTQVTKHVIDPRAMTDLLSAFKTYFGIQYEDVAQLIGSFHRHFKCAPHFAPPVLYSDFVINLEKMYGVSVKHATLFFDGLVLHKTNKMPLSTLVVKPYHVDRLLYRPVPVWNVDGKDYCVIGASVWDEAVMQLATNAIPWGKAPSQWLSDPAFSAYMHQKEDEHDKWLDDAVEQKLSTYLFDRNIKKLATGTGSVNIEIKDVGEIDFIIVSAAANKIFIVDCKHLHARYDMVNQKNDVNAFTGSGKKEGYNRKLEKKVDWCRNNMAKVQEHFQIKYPNDHFDFSSMQIEGIFVVNSPTFYMYNSPLRIYTLDQLPDVLDGSWTDPSFFLYVTEEEKEGFISSKYPYFRKPKYVELPYTEDD